jgi:hypothetical protein
MHLQRWEGVQREEPLPSEVIWRRDTAVGLGIAKRTFVGIAGPVRSKRVEHLAREQPNSIC